MLDPPGPPAPQVLLKHKMQTGNIECEDKNNCKCVDGDPQVQRFGKGSSGGYAIFTRYPSEHIKPTCTIASTSRSYVNLYNYIFVFLFLFKLILYFSDAVVLQ